MASDDPSSAHESMAVAYERHAADGASTPTPTGRPSSTSSATFETSGCSTQRAAPGLYLEELLQRGAVVTAFDASEEMIALARQH